MRFRVRDILNFIKTIPNDWYIEDYDEETSLELLDESLLKAMSPDVLFEIKRSTVWLQYQGEDLYGNHEPKEFTAALRKWLKEHPSE